MTDPKTPKDGTTDPTARGAGQGKAGDGSRGQAGGSTPTPHDALVRALLEDPERAQALIRDHLPNDITALIAPEPPEILNGSYVDEALRGSHSDLLMQVTLTSGKPAFLYVLVEHKSTPDHGTLLQLAGYMVRIWQRFSKGKAQNLKALPPIIPLLLYSGQGSWDPPQSLREMIDTDHPDMAILPGERVLFRWLTPMPPETLSGDAELRAGFLTLTRRALGAFLRQVLDGIDGNAGLQEQVLTYIVTTYPDLDLEDLIGRIRAEGTRQMEGRMTTIAETLIAKGEARGEARGKAAGMAEGEARGQTQGQAQSLIRLLERRFGPLSDPQRARITGAEMDQMDRWLDRVLDAPSLEVFFRGD